MRPNLKESGILVSDFIDERNGYLQLTDEEYTRAKAKNPTTRKHEHQLLAYGESKVEIFNIIIDLSDAAKPSSNHTLKKRKYSLLIQGKVQSSSL